MQFTDVSKDNNLQTRVIAMAGISFFKSIRKVIGLAAAVVVLSAPFAGQVHAADFVTTVKDDSGWKLQVNGEDFYIKGVVWSYSPRGKNYSYNLWAESDDFIRKVLDYEFGMMAAAGINANRSFTVIPPEWVEYIYREHGIMSVINPLMGRYGASIGGKWVPFTDYSDELTRATLKTEVLEVIEKYKNTPGVLMFALGNESNYGLSWSSFEIENLPEGEQNTAKARYLYSLFAEVIEAGQKIAPNHPFTIVNGDIQYIDLIAEYLADMPILGTNVYRGKSFTSLWRDVDEKLDMPIVFFEFGSDAFNAREMEEDQVAQAEILKAQWLEMYNKAAGNGEEGNAIGGFVFEWRDEWWKYLQTENLDVQDTNASWSNQAYLFDWVEGENNMNEEWFGITALGTKNADGVYTARQRMAYDVLAEIWQMDPYTYKKAAFNQEINDLDMDLYALKGEVRQLKAESKEQKSRLRFEGGSLIGELVVKGEEESIRIDGENALEFENGQMVFLDIGFNPNQKIEGQMSINILGNVANKEPLEIAYGRRALPVDLVVERDPLPEEAEFLPPDARVTDVVSFDDRERIEIYDFNAKYEGDEWDIEAFYHTPRYHWMNEGDFFGLVRETTDMAGQDIWNAKAPSGVEFAGKEGWGDGLKVLAGDEVFWGANPKVILKYSWNWGRTQFTFMHDEDIARRGDSASATQATEIQTRRTTLYAKRDFAAGWTLEVGGIFASNEKIDDTFTRYEDGTIYLDQIKDEDTLGARVKLTFPVFGHRTWVGGHYAGLVADGGDVLREFGIMDPTMIPYSQWGNKMEFDAGMNITFGNIMLTPRVMYRENLVDANPSIPAEIDPNPNLGELFPGIGPRNRDDDPFAVLDNREARSAEIFLTYDPTGETFFYEWDNDYKEDAKFAFNLGGNYTEYPTATDSFQFFSLLSNSNAAFGTGLPSENVWSASSRMVFNPTQRNKYIVQLKGGFQQSTGNAEGGSREFYELHGKVILRNKHVIEGYFKKDAWGPYDFHRQFNVIFPEQFKLDYSVILDGSGFQPRETRGTGTRVGIRTLYRGYDPEDEMTFGESQEGLSDYQFMTVFYVEYVF